MSTKKTESIEEYLARGGKISIVPSVQVDLKHVVPRKNAGTVGAISMLTMDEAELFFSDTKVKPRKIKSPKIDISALPPEVKAKFIDKFLNGDSENEEEKDNKED